MVGDFSGVSKASASRIVRRVSEAIAKLRPMFVKFPENLQTVIRGFYEIARFPRVTGVMDCTHVPIKSTGQFSDILLCTCSMFIMQN